MLREITASITLGDGTPLPSGTLKCIPIEQIVVDGDNVAVKTVSFTITTGAIPSPSYLVAPGWYSIEIWDASVQLQCFQVYISDDATPVSIYDLYVSSYNDPPSTPGVVYLTEGSSILLLTPGAGTEAQVLTIVGGAIAWADSSATASNTLSVTAGENLSGRKGVSISNAAEAVYADKDTSNQQQRVIGITTGAASIGAPATIQTSGLMTEVSWSWNLLLPIFLGTSGALTQTVPSTGAIIQLATPISATSIQIDIKLPLVKA